ncbi:hypothetical protein C482_02746 [Natrialba chahannaoensis JCM 10990]|uniref:Uncharacterized protein n=1 Tax=Natrialba chahannaoensis JCM 10990 TaxID=1227492 RepID=M0B3D6_9EURY|nr:hypothetical protein C482_02746 [Natrialba chahannaoensis JCM 10990]
MGIWAIMDQPFEAVDVGLTAVEVAGLGLVFHGGEERIGEGALHGDILGIAFGNGFELIDTGPEAVKHAGSPLVMDGCEDRLGELGLEPVKLRVARGEGIEPLQLCLAVLEATSSQIG